MKKILFFLLLIIMSVRGMSQDKKPSIYASMFAGGLWTGSNTTTTFVGFMGPKVSVTTKINSTYKLEIGLNGVPGLMVRPEMKLGLSAGATLTLKKESWKMKPVFGVMFIKTNKWQAMPGIGFVF